VVYCHWCAKVGCKERRKGPTVCGDFVPLKGFIIQHTIEDMPAEPLHDDQDDIQSRA